MSRPVKQTALRLPVDLHAKLVAAAAENNRSCHAEMLYRLVQSLRGDTGVTELKADFSALEERALAHMCAAKATATPRPWELNTGTMPVSADTLVEWRVHLRGLRGMVMGPEPAGELRWEIGAEPGGYDIMVWRLAK